jgi:hypothetical protein
MSEEPSSQPVPVLSYYPEDRSAALRRLVRLVLMVGAANGLLGAISFIANFLPPWSIPPRVLDGSILAGQVIAWLTLSISCLVVLKSGSGRMVAVSAQVIALLLDACYYVRQAYLYGELGYTILMATSVLSDWLLPLLVIVVLLRQEMRPR